jgi:hypothetical protein
MPTKNVNVEFMAGLDRAEAQMTTDPAPDQTG